MSRHQALKQLNARSRNQLRDILTNGGADAISRLSTLRSKLGKHQAIALESVLIDPAPSKGVTSSSPFPKAPPFRDTLQTAQPQNLGALLGAIEKSAKNNIKRLNRQFSSFRQIDIQFGEATEDAIPSIVEHVKKFGWSHTILRRLVLVRELLDDEDDRLENLVWAAGLDRNNIVVTSLIHAYTREQNYLSIKRSTLNIADRGSINRYTRTLTRLPFQPFAKDQADLLKFLGEIFRCSLADAVILAKFNEHLFPIAEYPTLDDVSKNLGTDDAFSVIISRYQSTDSDCEHHFFQQSSAWLEYDVVRSYRILADHFYDASREDIENLPDALNIKLQSWLGEKTSRNLVDGSRITDHQYESLAALERTGTVTRSAIFNYWLFSVPLLAALTLSN